jgi:hypothetical protein
MNQQLTASQIYNIKVAQLQAKAANHAQDPSPFTFTRKAPAQ